MAIYKIASLYDQKLVTQEELKIDTILFPFQRNSIAGSKTTGLTSLLAKRHSTRPPARRRSRKQS